MSEKIILIRFCLMLVVSSQEFGLPGGSVVKNLPAMQETGVQSLGREDLEEGMATHSSTLFWRIPWTEEPGRLQSMGSERGRHDSTCIFYLFIYFWHVGS